MHPERGVPRLPRLPALAHLALLLVQLLTSGVAAAEIGSPGIQGEPDAGVVVSVGAERVATGEGLPVQVSYSWSDPWRPRHRPSPAAAFSNEALTSLQEGVSSSSGGRHTLSYTLVVQPPGSGPWLLPRLSMSLLGPGGEEREVIAPAVVAMVGPAEADQRPAPCALVVPHPPDPRRRWAWTLAGCARHRRRVRPLVCWPSAGGPRDRRQLLAERLAAELAQALHHADGRSAGASAALALRSFAGAQWRFDGAGATAREAAQQVARAAPPEEARGSTPSCSRISTSSVGAPPG